MVKQFAPRLLLALCLAVVLAWIFGLGPSRAMRVAPEALTHEEGQRYVVDVPSAVLAGLPVPADANDDPAASTAVVYENGKPISLPHRTGQAIATLGDGRLSHWGSSGAQDVYLSSSDGSDPRSNGRSYDVVFVSPPPAWLAVAAALVLLVAGALRAAGARGAVPAAITLAAMVIAVWIWVFAGSVLISPDSATYIRFHPWVPSGYPIFVATVAWAFGYTAIPAVQLLLVGAAALYLASAVGRLTGSQLACAATVVVIAADAPLMRFAGYLLSESLYATLLLACAGAGLRLVDGFSRAASLTFAAAAALAWSVRPAGAYLALVTFYLALLVREVRARTVIAWLVAPMLGCFALVQMTNQAVHQPNAVSQTGRILFGQVALQYDPATARPQYRAVAERIGAALAPYQATFEALPTWTERHAFAVASYADRVTAVDQVLISNPARDPRSDAAMLVALTLDSLAARPGAYLRWVLEDFVWSWRTKVFAMLALPSAVDLGWYADRPGERAQLIGRFALPVTEEQVTITEGRILTPAGRAVDLLRRVLRALVGFAPLVLAFGAFLMVSVAIAPFSRSPTLRALGLLGAMAHVAIGAISATTAPIERYVAPTDPLVLVAAVIAVQRLVQMARATAVPAARVPAAP